MSVADLPDVLLNDDCDDRIRLPEYLVQQVRTRWTLSSLI